MLGFYFANQAKILEFLAEDNDQKLMNKLRTTCEMAENKTRSFVDMQIKHEYKEIESVSREIFEVRSTRASQSNFHKNLATADQEVTAFAKNITSKSLHNRDGKQFFERTSDPSEEDDRLKTPLNRSKVPSNSKIPTFHLQSKYQVEPRKQQEQDISKMSSAHGMNSFTPSHYMTNPTAYYDILKDREVRKKVIHSQPCEVPRLSPNPFSAIERKLATFDIRNNSRPKSGYKTEPRAPTPELVRLGSRPEPIPQYTCTHEAPNVDSLRFFRQKIRDKFAKECSNLRRNLFTY